MKLGSSTIPSIGYGIGTKWFKSGGDVNQEIVTGLLNAVNQGFTHIDTAEGYGNYTELKLALDQLDRSKLFITDKFSTYIKDPNHRPYTVLKETLKYLDLKYVDLYLIHSPFITEKDHGFTIQDAWDDLVKLKKEGLAKHIGVSNFAVKDLQGLEGVEVNQIEFSPFLQNQTPGIVEYCHKNGILIEAYSPQTPITNPINQGLDEYLGDLGEKYGKTKGQIILRWVLDRNILPITTTSKVERLKEYLDVLKFKLTEEEVKKIDTLGDSTHFRKYWTAQYSP